MAMDLNAMVAYIRGPTTGMEFDLASKNGGHCRLMDLLEEMACLVSSMTTLLNQVYDELETLTRMWTTS